jgi:hypothetical protein
MQAGQLIAEQVTLSV